MLNKLSIIFSSSECLFIDGLLLDCDVVGHVIIGQHLIVVGHLDDLRKVVVSDGLRLDSKVVASRISN